MADTTLRGRRLGLCVATTAGGTGRHVRAVVDVASAAGMDVVVAGPAATEADFHFTAGGARFVPVEIAERLDPIQDVVVSRHARRAMADRDVVHAHGLRAGLVAGYAVRRGVPLVVTWHNAILRGGAAGRLLGLAEGRIARRATVTLCVSPDLVDRVRGLGGRDVRLAPVGSTAPVRSPADLTAIRTELGVDDDTVLVLAIGRLHPQKGFDLLIAASVDVARAASCPVRFVIAGDGPVRADLAALVSRSAAPVQLLGWRDDTGDLLAAADLVVMPSRWEGSPLSAHETLLAGRPLVAAAVGGLPGLLGGGAATLVPAEDVGALTDAIVRLVDDDTERAALAARGAERGALWPDAMTAAANVVDVYAELAR